MPDEVEDVALRDAAGHVHHGGLLRSAGVPG